MVCNYARAEKGKKVKKVQEHRLLKGFDKLNVSQYLLLRDIYCFLFRNNVICKRLLKAPGNFPKNSFLKKEDET